MTIIISSCSAARDLIAAGDINVCVSISSPPGSTFCKRPSNLHSVPEVHEFTIDDLSDDPSAHAPTEDTVRRFLAAMAPHRRAFFQSSPKVLIHCFAGWQRSTAFAVIGFAEALGAGREVEAFARAEASSVDRKNFNPNSVLIALGDSVLGRGGALSRCL